MLKNYDTGISEIGFRRITQEDLKNTVRDLRAHFDEIGKSSVPFGIRLKDALYYIDYSQGRRFSRFT